MSILISTYPLSRTDFIDFSANAPGGTYVASTPKSLAEANTSACAENLPMTTTSMSPARSLLINRSRRRSMTIQISASASYYSFDVYIAFLFPFTTYLNDTSSSPAILLFNGTTACTGFNVLFSFYFLSFLVLENMSCSLSAHDSQTSLVYFWQHHIAYIYIPFRLFVCNSSSSLIRSFHHSAPFDFLGLSLFWCFFSLLFLLSSLSRILALMVF